MDELQRRSLAYISDRYQWYTLLCPLKRSTDNGLEHAYMVGNGPNIYHGNMFIPQQSDRCERFASYEAIIAAGWVVD